MAICVFSNQRSVLFAEDCFDLNIQLCVVGDVETMVPNQGVHHDEAVGIVSETTHSS